MKKIISFAVLLLALVSAFSCAKESGAGTGGKKLAAPEIKIAALGTTSFSIKWGRVEGAARYEYSFADVKATTDTTVLTLSELLENTEYTVAVTAIPREGSADAASEPAYIHILTAEVAPLPSPVITLGCAYASRTVINWSSVSGASGYSYTLGGQSGTTQGTRLELSNLKPGQDYTFTVKALSGDTTLSLDSGEASLSFTTETGDIPALIISPSGTGADYATFEVFAMPEVTYYQDMIPTTSLINYTEEEIIKIYSEAIIKYAQSQSVSFPLAMASALKAGSQSFKIGGLVSELSYNIIAFGMDVQGHVTTGLYTKPVKTTRTGYSDGPNFGSCTWFSQEVYMDKQYAATLGLNLTNSFFTRWKGDNVVSVKYRAFPTETFLKAFPTLDENAIREILSTPGYYTEVGEALLSMVNEKDGLMKVTQCEPATSYTVAALARNASGEEVLVVNSIGTKSIADEKTWFLTGLGVNEEYGPTSEKMVASFMGVNIVGLRYGLFKTENIVEIPKDRYYRLVEEHGHDLTGEQLEHVNDGGLGFICTVEPGTSYTLVATATNTAGDQLTKYSVASTTAAVKSAVSGLADRTVTEKMPFSEEELWREIHNQKLLEKR